mmetsp:Transcript_35064/g.41852  ORF Transcript_35064/g.41852 Transcript_35064/m.41852 type:complete len:106 (-) Transcript_35064:348-665(-)
MSPSHQKHMSTLICLNTNTDSSSIAIVIDSSAYGRALFENCNFYDISNHPSPSSSPHDPEVQSHTPISSADDDTIYTSQSEEDQHYISDVVYHYHDSDDHYHDDE